MSQPWREEVSEGLERFYLQLALAPAPREPEQFLQHLFEQLELPENTRSFLEQQGFRRLLVYRKLVRRNLRDAVEVAMPRAAARMGNAFDVWLARYFDGAGPRSRYLRDITGEFLDFCERHRDEQGPVIASFVLELARLEAARIEVAAEAEQETETFDLDLEAGLAFARATRLLHFSHAVHRLPDDQEDRSEPERSETHLLAYRDAQFQVRYLELSPVASCMVDKLRGGSSLGAAVRAACEEQAIALDQSVLEGSAHVLGDLAERGVIIGATRLHAGE